MPHIVLQNLCHPDCCPALAKEIGAEEAMALIALERAIRASTSLREGHRVIARSPKELSEHVITWRKPGRIRGLLDELQTQGFIFLFNDSLFDKEAVYIGLNWQRIQELNSVGVILDSDATPAPVPPSPGQVKNGNGKPESYQWRALWGAFLTATNWNSNGMTGKDKGEMANAIKGFLKLPRPQGGTYADEEVDRLVSRILGFRVYWEKAFPSLTLPNPSTIVKRWSDYGKYCKTYCDNKPPEIPTEWRR